MEQKPIYKTKKGDFIMSFSENLKAVRQDKKLSQEDLAELLGVSRQAVSKWEQDSGYPETEKLIQIAQKLDVSLDSLLLDKQTIDGAGNGHKGDMVVFPIDKKITIQTMDGKTTSAFYKFRINKTLIKRQGKPHYMISGTDNSSFLGDNIVELGWYMTHEDAQKELSDIYAAIQNGEPTYELKYTTDIKPSLINIVN